MVKAVNKIILVCLFFVALPSIAGEFKAHISRSQTPSNQPFTLTLVLQDSKPTAEPDISTLKSNFDLLGTSRFSSTNVINMEVSTTKKWVYRLKAKNQGSFKLGPFKIATKDGELETETIGVKISAAKARPSKDTGSGIFVEAKLSNSNPYNREPIIYTVKLYTPNNISGAALNNPKIEGATIKRNGEHKISSEEKDGLTYSVVTWRFTIIPHREGVITVQPIEIAGNYEPGDNSYRSIFDDPLRQFSFDNFGTKIMKPFRVGTKAQKINVQSIASNIETRLIAQALTLEEEYDTKQLKVGEPITRKIIIHAVGVVDGKLPELSIESKGQKYKVYEEPVQASTKYEGELITSFKSKSFTIIPGQQGEITVPAVTVEYFNSSNGKLETASLPERKFYVKQGAAIVAKQDENTEDDSSVDNQREQDESADTALVNALPVQLNWPLILALGVMSLIAIALFIRARSLKQRLKNAEQQHQFFTKDKQISKAHKLQVTKKEISSAKDVHELRAKLQQYASEHWGVRPNSSIQQVLRQVELSADDRSLFAQLATKIDKAIYLNVDHDLSNLKMAVSGLLEKVEESSKLSGKKGKKGRLKKMNPGV